MSTRDIINLIKQQPEATDAEIVAAYNAASYAPLTPPTIAAWLANAGRLLSLRTFAAEHDADDPPQVTGLRSAVDTLLLSLGVPGVTLDLAPASEQRQLVEAIASIGLRGVGSDDVAVLVAKAQTRPLIGESDVAAARVQIAKAQAVADFIAQAEATYQQTAEAAQARRDADIAAYRALVEAWDGVGDAPEIE